MAKKEEGACLPHRRLSLPMPAAIVCGSLFLSLCLFRSLTNADRLHLRTLFNDAVRLRPTAEKEHEFHQKFGDEFVDSNKSKSFYGCSNASRNFVTSEVNTKPNRYLLIAASGGLNQQRTAITDAVVAAYILNATLVVPMLDQQSFWNDSSNFSDIFDVDWFKAYLSNDVKIIEQLPDKTLQIVTKRVPMRCDPKCYLSQVLPIYNEHVHVVRLKKFNYRLSNWLVDEDLQKLRCRVNYHSLRFSSRIREMGDKLVERMRSKNEHFVALHLRYEPDMLAYSGCYYGGGDKEREELGELRKRWISTKPDPDRQRREGKCLLNPEEVGLMLRALGFGTEVHIFVASGRIYRGDEALTPLKNLFPKFHSKETLASKEEMAEFAPYATRMAALDFIVCDESEVFVANNNGNMPKILSGKRRYFGHKPTIRPNTRMLNPLFLNRNSSTWQEFSSLVRKVQIGFMGEPSEVYNRKDSFHENPLSCICRTT